jgi:hypothetical protein
MMRREMRNPAIPNKLSQREPVARKRFATILADDLGQHAVSAVLDKKRFRCQLALNVS